MSAERLDAVITAVEQSDQELARWMRLATGGLTAGEGEEVITQADFQRYLWYDLPRRSPDDAWRPVAEAAAVLLALLGLDRYAAIARSTTTAAVLDTELLAWGETFGMEEAWALQAVEVALERAIVAGEFQPGRGSWRKVAARVCDEVLQAPAGDGPLTRLQAALGERADTWVAQGDRRS